MRGLQVPRNVYVAIDRHRSAAAGERRVRGAGRQSARAQRRELHADQPARHEADLSAACSATTGCGRSSITRRLLLATLRSLAPEGRPEPTIVLLTPGVYQLGVLRAHVSGAADGHRAGGRARPGDPRQHGLHADHGGLKRVDVIYRRVDDDFIDPLAFRGDSILGRGGAVQCLSRGQRDAGECVRHGRGRRQGAVCLCARRSSSTTWARSRCCRTWRRTC